MVWTGGGGWPFPGSSSSCGSVAGKVPKGSGPIATSDGSCGTSWLRAEGMLMLHHSQLRCSLVEPLAIGLLCSQLVRQEVDPGQA